jgi:hypothetical protein
MVPAPPSRLLFHNIHSIRRGLLLWFTVLGSTSHFSHLQSSNRFSLEHAVKATERPTIHVNATHPATRNKELGFCSGYRCVEKKSPQVDTASDRLWNGLFPTSSGYPDSLSPIRI